MTLKSCSYFGLHCPCGIGIINVTVGMVLFDIFIVKGSLNKEGIELKVHLSF